MSRCPATYLDVRCVFNEGHDGGHWALWPGGGEVHWIEGPNPIDSFLDPPPPPATIADDEKVKPEELFHFAPDSQETPERQAELRRAFFDGFRDEGNIAGILETGGLVKKKPEKP